MYDIKQVINGMFKSVDDLAAKGIVDHSFKVKVHHEWYRLYLDYYEQEAEVLIDIEMKKPTFGNLNENITTKDMLKGIAEVGNAYIRQVNAETMRQRIEMRTVLDELEKQAEYLNSLSREVDDVVEGLRNPFIHGGSKDRNTRQEIEKYLEEKMPGQWDEWNVRMSKISWDREDGIYRSIEGGK